MIWQVFEFWKKEPRERTGLKQEHDPLVEIFENS